MGENYLKEYENKLQLSKLFSNHYREIYNNVDKDDHDVKYSMSSLTVQLFTTPSVVEHLIEKEDIMESMFEILVERYFPPKLNGQRSLRSIQKGYKNIHSAKDYMSCSSSKLSSDSDQVANFATGNSDDAIVVYPNGTIGRLKMSKLKLLKGDLNEIKPESEEEKILTGTLKRT